MVGRTLLSAATRGARAIAWRVQRTLIYPVPPTRGTPRSDAGEVVRIDGDHALFVPPAPGQRTIAHFHGNAETLADVVPLAHFIAQAGLGVYAIEYPGYGLSRGPRPSERSLYAGAERALRHLRDALGIVPEQTVLQGQSLGTGVATEMCLRGHGHRLILVSPFTSMTAMVRRFAPMLPPALLVEDRFDTIAKAPKLDVPTLVIHGARDTLVPTAMGQRVAATIPGAELVLSPSAGHNDLFEVDGERLLRKMIDFARGPA